MTTIHVHGAGGYEYVFVSRRSRDAGSLRAMYDDLVQRMVMCARDTMARAKTHDDFEGHAFHGNQHTGGIKGPHKDKGTHTANVQLALASKEIKSAKMAVHALLSSGHPFSKEELAVAVGMDPTGKTINDYLTNLKNPKFAGPQGALKIEKNAQGHFFVALPNGDPAPPPDTKMDLSKVAEKPALPSHLKELAAKMDAPKHTVTEVNVPGYTEPPAPPPVAAPAPPPVPQPHVPEPSYDPVAHDIGVSAFTQLTAAAPGSVAKQKADDLYSEAKLDAAAVFKENLENGMSPDTAAIAHKNAQSAAMAAWATAVHGHPFKPTVHQKAFAADIQMAKDLQSGMGSASAMLKWKKNTALEKSGNFPPKPAPSVTMTPVKATHTPAPTKVVDMGHPAYVPPIDYHTLRPATHVDIDEDDVMSRKFTKGILKLKKDLGQDSNSSVTNKKTVEQKLRARLMDKPNFQALVKRVGLPAEGMSSLESKLIQAWAGSSGDSHDISVALQMAVKDAFDLPDKYIEKKALTALDAHGHDVDKLVSSAITSVIPLGNPSRDKPLQPHEISTARAALQEFVQAQYHETQEYLKAKGHTHVFLARGMKIKTSHNNVDGPAAVKLQPASSFSANYATAQSFAGSGTVFISKVPREQVLSTYMTGFGCTGEHEVVVLAHDKMKAYTMSGYSAASATAAQAALQQQFKQAHPGMKIAPPSAGESEEDY